MTGRYRALQGVTRVDKGLQGFTWGYKGLHGVAAGYRELQRFTENLFFN